VSWGLRFRLREGLRGSLWVAPLAAVVAGVLLAELSGAAEGAIDVPSEWRYSSGTAETVLTTVIASAVGLTGFVVTVSVLVVQTATGTFSARYMRLWCRDRVLKAVLAVLVGTFTFAYTLLRDIEGSDVPDVGVTAAGVLLGGGIVLFLIFFHRSLPDVKALGHAPPRSGRGHGSSPQSMRAASERSSTCDARVDEK
jgi:uncharacterized membrane protein